MAIEQLELFSTFLAAIKKGLDVKIINDIIERSFKKDEAMEGTKIILTKNEEKQYNALKQGLTK